MTNAQRRVVQFLTICTDEENDRGSDDEFDPKSKKPKSKGKQRQNDAPSSIIPEHARALHTLEEDHNYLLAAAFEGSLSGSGQGGAGFEPSSSVIDGGFAFDDDVFALPEGAGVADIGDELARELGEGWGGSIGQVERQWVLYGYKEQYSDPYLAAKATWRSFGPR